MALIDQYLSVQFGDAVLMVTFVALVFYTEYTYSLYKEAKKANVANYLPFIHIDNFPITLESEMENANSLNTRGFRLVNIGKGIAYNVQVEEFSSGFYNFTFEKVPFLENKEYTPGNAGASTPNCKYEKIKRKPIPESINISCTDMAGKRHVFKYKIENHQPTFTEMD